MELLEQLNKCNTKFFSVILNSGYFTSGKIAHNLARVPKCTCYFIIIARLVEIRWKIPRVHGFLETPSLEAEMQALYRPNIGPNTCLNHAPRT